MPREKLRNLYLLGNSKASVAPGLCPNCSKVLEFVEAWERACSDETCGYKFSYREWPWISARRFPAERT